MKLFTIKSVVIFLVAFLTLAEAKVETYRAAVVEYEPYFKEHIKPSELLLTNAEKYADYAEEAAKLGAIIIAFPEYGTTSLESDNDFVYTRDNILPYSQSIPNPEVNWNPCLNPNEYNNTEALHVISCAAKNNSIAILANLVSIEVCNKQTDPDCPNDDRYMYNTNVVFDKNGKLIARYHKNHLYGEHILNSPKQAEYIIFEIEGIKFGTFICFDLIYADPAVKLVTEHGIKNLIFSTAWINEMPFLTAPQFYSRYARGLGVNLIVTNYYKPQYSRLGTGIYSSQTGALNKTYDIARKGRLLTADIPLDPNPIPEGTACSAPIQSTTSIPNEKSNSFISSTMTDKPSSKPVDPINKYYYQSLNNFTAIPLQDPQGTVNLCQHDACCTLVYSYSQNGDTATYALLASDGIHPFGAFNLGFQTCAVMRCEKAGDIETCGRVPNSDVSAVFDQLSLTAQLKSDHVLPSILKGDLQILNGEDWSYSISNCGEGKTESKIAIEKPSNILVASLYARLYDRDSEKPGYH